MTGHAGETGDIVWQPSWVWWDWGRVRNRVGEIVANPAGPRFSDSAYVRLNTGVDILPVIWFSQLLQDHIVDWRIRIAVPIGAIVDQEGRTTGRTQGIVTARGVTKSHRIFGELFSQTVVESIDPAYPFGGGGDSGGPVFITVRCLVDERFKADVVGLLWGGLGDEYFFSPICNVQYDLLLYWGSGH